MSEESIILAGRTAKKVLEGSRGMIKEGVKYLDVAEKLEKQLLDSGVGIGFPVNISVNDAAAHDSARPNDTRTFQKGDLVKIDLGAHVNGFIADNAYTSEITTDKHSKLIECTNRSLEAAISTIKTGVKIKEIGNAVQKVMDSYGFSSVKNLVGHSIGRYEIHAGLNIPNYKNNDNTVLKEGMLIAIEPYATYGKGFAINAKDIEVFSIESTKPIRVFQARKLFDWVFKERRTLPFCRRWVEKEFGNRTDFLLTALVKTGNIHAYPVLKEVSGEVVSQTEDSILVKEEPIITTKIV